MPQVAIQEFGVEQLIEVLSNAGYEHDATEFNDSLIHYFGEKDNQYVFAVSFLNTEDTGDEGLYYVTTLFVERDETGLLCGEWEGRPSKEDLTNDQVIAYFDGLKDQASYK